jgi:hypothetical protein
MPDDNGWLVAAASRACLLSPMTADCSFRCSFGCCLDAKGCSTAGVENVFISAETCPPLGMSMRKSGADGLSAGQDSQRGNVVQGSTRSLSPITEPSRGSIVKPLLFISISLLCYTTTLLFTLHHLSTYFFSVSSLASSRFFSSLQFYPSSCQWSKCLSLCPLWAG